MKYIGMKANSMMAGAFTPARIAPPLATMKPRLAANEYAGAVEAMPTTTLPTSPSDPDLSPLSTAVPSVPLVSEPPGGGPAGAGMVICTPGCSNGPLRLSQFRATYARFSVLPFGFIDGFACIQALDPVIIIVMSRSSTGVAADSDGPATMRNRNA